MIVEDADEQLWDWITRTVSALHPWEENWLKVVDVADLELFHMMMT